jgi:hypothetical protein
VGDFFTLGDSAKPKAAANLTGKVLLYYNSIAVPFPYMVAGVVRAVQDVVGQEKVKKVRKIGQKSLQMGVMYGTLILA